MFLYMFSQKLKTTDDVQEATKRNKTQEIANEWKRVANVHPISKVTRDELWLPAEGQESLASPKNVHDQFGSVDDITGALGQKVVHGDALDESQVLSVFGSFIIRKREARRNFFEASTCLVEAVYKNNSVLAQMFTDALMPLCSSAASCDLDFEALLADAIKRGCSLSIINNVNQLWLKTQKKRKAKQLFDEYV